MIAKQLRDFLDSHHVKYVTIIHSPAYTAMETAHAAHVRGKEMAKTVIAKLDGKMAMLVLPASYRVYPDLLRDATGAKVVELAGEVEFADKFPECEPGAMPPFGNLYGMDVYVDQTLAEDEEIAFNAGTHTELMRMAWIDYEELVEPTLGTFAFKPNPEMGSAKA
jgi:Ala-tRNA(Pro) deacylase